MSNIKIKYNKNSDKKITINSSYQNNIFFISEFQSQVYNVCIKIPKGKLATYGQIANVIKSSPRAVGQALKKNPFAPHVPCHRVINSNLEIGGFSPSGLKNHDLKIRRKFNLLKNEGIEFNDNKISSKCFLINIDELLM